MLEKRKGWVAGCLFLSFLLVALWRWDSALGRSQEEAATPQPNPALFEESPSTEAGAANLPLALDAPCPRKVLFLDDQNGLDNTGTFGFSILKDTLVTLGFEVDETFPTEINASLIEGYDLIVFSLGWAGQNGQRELSDAEAAALVNYVNSGKSLFLVGELGLTRAAWAHPWKTSLNKISKVFGITFKSDMLCSSASHLYYPEDPDGGVDIPIITDLSGAFHWGEITQFSISWGATLQADAPSHAVAFSDSSSWEDRTCSWDLAQNQWLCQQSDGESSGTYPVLAAYDSSAGRLVAIGDSSWLLNGWIVRYDNLKLAANAFSWLARWPSTQSLTAKPNPAVAPQTVFFTCNADDPYSGARVAEYRWDFNGDGKIDAVTTKNKANHLYEDAGTYAVTCRQVDIDGCSSTSPSLSIKVSPNTPPVIDVFTATPTAGNPPLKVQFTCEAHDADGSIKKYLFDFGDGSPIYRSKKGRPHHAYQQGGVFNATCTAVDAKGGETKSQPLSIAVNIPPVLDSFSATPREGKAPLKVIFSCQAHAVEGTITRYQWRYGDGKFTSTVSGATHHRYLTAGSYDSTCAAFDRRGAKITSSPLSITVE